MLPAALAEEYLRQREALLQAFPELGEDEITLRDTLEGITGAPDLIAMFIRDARADEAYAESLNSMIKDMTDRKGRFDMRAGRRRLAALRMMEACELRKIEFPDFTASIRAVPSKLEISDAQQLPDEVCVVTRLPSRALIREALAKGPVAGAHFTNGGSTLTIRTK